MSRRRDSTYTGSGKTLQGKVPDHVHKAAHDQAAKAGMSFQKYLEYMVAQHGKQLLPIPQDPIRPENRNIHKKLEALWNELDERERAVLEQQMDAWRPKIKGKRAS